MNGILANNSSFRSVRSTSWRGLLETEKSLFVAANLMDVVMTLLLLETGAFRESNPIADFILDGWGVLGMAGYKFVLVALILVIANIVAIWRIETSRKLLNFGSLVVGAVVTYSIYLMISFQGSL